MDRVTPPPAACPGLREPKAPGFCDKGLHCPSIHDGQIHPPPTLPSLEALRALQLGPRLEPGLWSPGWDLGPGESWERPRQREHPHRLQCSGGSLFADVERTWQGPLGWPARGQSVETEYRFPKPGPREGSGIGDMCDGGRVGGWPEPKGEAAWCLIPRAGAGQES